jgi:hypothetical protein
MLYNLLHVKFILKIYIDSNPPKTKEFYTINNIVNNNNNFL